MPECKAIYRSMRDAVRYKRNKTRGKSGDSADDMHIDESSKEGGDSNDYLSFLTPTSSRFPRKTTVLGGARSETPTSTASSQQTLDGPTEEDIADEQAYDPFNTEEDSNNSSAYSFVRISFNLFRILVQ